MRTKDSKRQFIAPEAKAIVAHVHEVQTLALRKEQLSVDLTLPTQADRAKFVLEGKRFLIVDSEY